MKYFIYSESKGTYVGFFAEEHVFSNSDDAVAMDFLSTSGASAYLAIMPVMANAPDDCVVLPMYKHRQTKI